MIFGNFKRSKSEVRGLQSKSWINFVSHPYHSAVDGSKKGKKTLCCNSWTLLYFVLSFGSTPKTSSFCFWFHLCGRLIWSHHHLILKYHYFSRLSFFLVVFIFLFIFIFEVVLILTICRVVLYGLRNRLPQNTSYLRTIVELIISNTRHYAFFILSCRVLSLIMHFSSCGAALIITNPAWHQHIPGIACTEVAWEDILSH